MSGSVILQSDVGNLGIQGLGAFTNILATLSADNVTPMAMIQMEKLGATLPVSGKQAERVKGLLQRCNNVRLDRIALVIGWRKNDSASAMAQSAGGQAIALLSMCLTNLYTPAKTGTIISRLSSKLCAASANISSIRQLADVATLLGRKVDALGFGNLLAHEVMRIQEAYAKLGYSSAPPQLMDRLSIEVITDVFEKVSRALLQENMICRISGVCGMGVVVGMLQILFPRDTSLTIEGVVMQDVESPKIRCEIEQSKHDGLIEIHVETSISHTMPVNLPIRYQGPRDNSPWLWRPCSFVWSGWLAAYSRLRFSEFGLILDESILEACCDLLIFLPASLPISAVHKSSWESEQAVKTPAVSLLALLGPFPRERMCSILQMILGCRPTDSHLDLHSAFKKLANTLDHATREWSCDCTEVSNNWSEIYTTYDKNTRPKAHSCSRTLPARAVRKILNLGLLSLFVESGPNSTIRPFGSGTDQHFGGAFTENPSKYPWYAPEFVQSMLHMAHENVLGNYPGNTIARTCESSTIFPSILTSLQIPLRQLVTFSLVDGLIVYEQRYHTELHAGEVRERPEKRKAHLVGDMLPSHIGVHSGSALLTIRETFNCLEIHCSIQYAGCETKINLRDVIYGFCGLHWPGMCSHQFDTPLNMVKYPASATNVAEPTAFRRLGVAMTRRNPTAQFLCCQGDVPAILQRDCCLNCAAEALRGRQGVIIVG